MNFSDTLNQLQHIGLRVINNYYLRHTDGERRPEFYDIKTVCPQLLAFDQHLSVIQTELSRILVDTSKIPKYEDIDEVQSYISGDIHELPQKEDQAWKVYMLRLMGRDIVDNQLACPETTRLLKQVPNLRKYRWSKLE